MAPTVILIRHAEALHNAQRNFDLHDPELSELGVEQCAALQQHLRHNLPLADKVDLIVTSPMKRTLHTTAVALSWLVQRGVPVIARADWQETTDKPCDTGTHIDALAKEYDFDFSAVDPIYPAKTGFYAPTQTALIKRGVFCKRWLRSRPEKVVLVLSHSGFMRRAVAHSEFANADYRVYDFSEQEDSVELIEWSLTKSTGGGMGRSAIECRPVEEDHYELGSDENHTAPPVDGQSQ